MREGTVIADEAAAEAVNRAMRENPEVWEGHAEVGVGELVRLDPCIPASWPYARPDRPCPRVELDPQNTVAADLVLAALPEHTRPLMPAFMRARLAGLPADHRRRVTLRVVRALHSEPVSRWLYPKVTEVKS